MADSATSNVSTTKITKPIRGTAVSGRVWKTVQTKRNSSMKAKAIPRGWEKQLEARKQQEIVKRMQFEMKEEIRLAKEEKRKEAEERKKRKEENEKRAEVMQMVSAAKVKRMKKKQLKLLRKVGSDVSGSTVKRRKGGK
ncbi:hypothetical protein BDR26DRAFT_849659 [Obelidium mucronatum]|nr:hypothetical protein BDR26DRAFT_849659 [Obelidium mucronatum]